MKSVLLPLFIFLLIVTVTACRVSNAPPELSSVLPAEARIGQEITLTGYQFGPDPVVIFTQADTSVTATLTNHTEQAIKAIVPRMRIGQTQIRVTTQEGTSDPLPFIVQQPVPSVTGIQPSNGLPGTPVVLQGDFLNQLTSVQFGAVPAVIQDSTAQQVTVIIPGNVPRGPAKITVETKGGNLTGDFLVAGTPQITGISPKKARSGNELIIQGVNLTAGVVRINGQLTDPNQTRITDTEIRTVVPTPAASGRVSVTVFDQLTATSTDSLQVVYQPVVTGLNVTEGVRGDKVILNGQNLREVASVSFGGTPAEFRVLNDAQLEATVPALGQSGEVTISVNGIGGNANSPQAFLHYLTPTNLNFSPVRQVAGQEVSITGQNLYRITEVRIGTQPATISGRTEGSEVRIVVPANAVTGPISVANRAGSVASSRQLTVVQKAVVTEVTPAKGKPGDRVVLKGDFLQNAQIFFTGAAAFAADDGKNEDTERWVLVPSDAQSGPIRVVNATGQEVTTETFTVVKPAAAN